jgi:lambda family phage tail tape measure protein
LGYEASELDKINALIAQQPDKYKEVGDQLRANASLQDQNLRFLKEFTKEQERQKVLTGEINNIRTRGALEFQDFLLEQGRRSELSRANSEAERTLINERFDVFKKYLGLEQNLTTFKQFQNALLYEGDDLSAEQSKHIADHIALTQRLKEQMKAESDIRKNLTLEELNRTSTFAYGWDEAFKAYAESANNAGQQARDSFSTFTDGMEDAFVKFAQTGKLSFKSLADSIIADLVRIAVRRAIVGVIGGPLGSLFGGGRSAGGPVNAGTPYMVGERGPELFLPQSAGKIVSNADLRGSGQPAGGSGGSPTIVNYNIEAVDAASFRSLVARDPSFIYAVTEQGRRSQPTRSR